MNWKEELRLDGRGVHNVHLCLLHFYLFLSRRLHTPSPALGAARRRETRSITPFPLFCTRGRVRKSRRVYVRMLAAHVSDL